MAPLHVRRPRLANGLPRRPGRVRRRAALVALRAVGPRSAWAACRTWAGSCFPTRGPTRSRSTPTAPPPGPTRSRSAPVVVDVARPPALGRQEARPRPYSLPPRGLAHQPGRPAVPKEIPHEAPHRPALAPVRGYPGRLLVDDEHRGSHAAPGAHGGRTRPETASQPAPEPRHHRAKHLLGAGRRRYRHRLLRRVQGLQANDNPTGDIASTGAQFQAAAADMRKYAPAEINRPPTPMPTSWTASERRLPAGRSTKLHRRKRSKMAWPETPRTSDDRDLGRQESAIFLPDRGGCHAGGARGAGRGDPSRRPLVDRRHAARWVNTNAFDLTGP